MASISSGIFQAIYRIEKGTPLNSLAQFKIYIASYIDAVTKTLRKTVYLPPQNLNLGLPQEVLTYGEQTFLHHPSTHWSRCRKAWLQTNLQGFWKSLVNLLQKLEKNAYYFNPISFTLNPIFSTWSTCNKSTSASSLPKHVFVFRKQIFLQHLPVIELVEKMHDNDQSSLSCLGKLCLLIKRAQNKYLLDPTIKLLVTFWDFQRESDKIYVLLWLLSTIPYWCWVIDPSQDPTIIIKLANPETVHPKAIILKIEQYGRAIKNYWGTIRNLK